MISSSRSCYREDGNPKIIYDSFDEAMDAIATNMRKSSVRTHAYRCPFGCGYHIGTNRSAGLPYSGRSAVD
jgi:hypothetical protein